MVIDHIGIPNLVQVSAPAEPLKLNIITALIGQPTYVHRLVQIAHKMHQKFQKNGSETKCNVYTMGYDKGFTLRLDKIVPSDVEWENYILGVLNEISKLTDLSTSLKASKLAGFDCTIESDLPTGSGLSSSAAMECGLAYGLNDLFTLGLSRKTIIELSQRAEHTYVGAQCGIMDQFASVMSKEGHVILLDCRSLEHLQSNLFFARPFVDTSGNVGK